MSEWAAEPRAEHREDPARTSAHARGGQLAGIAISVVAVAAVTWWATRQEAPSFPTSAGSLALLGAAVAIYALATLLRGWRWHVVLSSADVPHERADALGLVCVGYMGNTVLPARGGEVLRVVLLHRRSGARRREVIGSIIAERLLDVVALVALFALLTWVGIAGTPTGHAPALAGLGCLTVGAAALAIYLRARRRGHLEAFAARVRPVARASKLLTTRRGGRLVALTIFVWLLEGAIFCLIGESLNLSVGLLEGVFLVVLASFFALIPAAPGYVGTYDAAILFGLTALDVGGGSAVGFALLTRFVLFLPITLTGLALMVLRYGGFRGVTADR